MEKRENGFNAEQSVKEERKVNREKIVNRTINILLVLGCVTVFFPLYMAVVIAFKSPSEMTNDVAGALALPSSFSFDNFVEAMKITDFWHSLGNSILLTGVTVIICIFLHSLAGYVIGRKMSEHKLFKGAYFYIVSGMFVPFAVLMMPLVKQTAQFGIWGECLENILENHLSQYGTDACNGGDTDRYGNME